MFETILSIAFVITLLGFLYKKVQVNNYKKILQMTEDPQIINFDKGFCNNIECARMLIHGKHD